MVDTLVEVARTVLKTSEVLDASRYSRRVVGERRGS